MGRIAKALRQEFESALRRKTVAFAALADTAREAESSWDYLELMRQG